MTTSDEIDPLSEGNTRTTTVSNTMTTKQDRNTSQTKTNSKIGEVPITIHDQDSTRHDKINPSQNFADKLDQIHLTLQYLTGLEIETRATI